MMLSIFSCASWSPVYLLWWNVYLGLPFIFWLGCLFFWYWAAWAVCIFWRLILCPLLHLQIFFPFCGLSFYLIQGFLYCANILSLIRYHFCFYSFLQEVDHEKSCYGLCQRMFPLSFPLRVFQCPALHLGL